MVFGWLASAGQTIDLAVQKGHSGDITFVVFNSNGRLIASAGTDHLIKLWHVPTGKEMASFVSGSSLTVTSLVFSDQDEWLFVEYEDGSIQTWNIATSTRQEDGPALRPHPKFPRQQRYVTADSSHQYYLEGFYLRKQDRRNQKILFSKVPIDISQVFTSLAVNEQEDRLVGACRDGKVYLFDSHKGKSLATREDHYASVNSVCFSPDGRMFATASSDRSIIVWDTRTLAPLKRLFSRAFRFESLAFDHSGLRLAAGDELGKGRIIDLSSSRINVETFPWHEQKISGIQFSADDRTVYSAGFDNRLVEFDLSEERVVKSTTYRQYVSLGDAFLKLLGAHRDPFAWLNAVAVSPSGRYVTTGGSWKEAEQRRQPQNILFMDAADRDLKLKSHQGGISSMTFVSDYLLATGHHNMLYLWNYDPADRKFYYRENHQSKNANITAIVPKGKDTLLLNTGHQVTWYDLKSESVVRKDTAKSEVTSITVNSARGEVVFADGVDLIFLNVRTPGVRQVVKAAHTDRITAMALSPTRPLLATASWDATIKFWNSATGELLATLVAVGNEDYILITPDNYYFGTRNSLKGVGFKFGKQFISPEQFDLKFNRPDIVVGRLGFAEPNVLKSYRRAYQKRLLKMNFTEEMLSGEIQLPELAVRNETVPLRTDQASITFRIEAKDSRYNIDRINVMVNQVPVFGIAGIVVRNRKQKDVQEEVMVQLSAGKNKIQLSCLNEKGTESLMETYEIESLVPQKKPDLYLAVVSVSSYDNQSRNLRYAVKDGRDLVSLYARKADAFEHVFVDTLFNENATKENIMALKEKLLKSSIGDQVVLYVSGHGLLDDNLDFYFGTHDLNFEDPASRGMKYDELENLLDGIPARKKLLMMDACHSGEVDKAQLQATQSESLTLEKGQKGTLKKYSYAPESADENRQVGMQTSFELMQELFTNLSKGSGSVVISAAAGNSYALESDEWKNGIFTYCLLNGLKTGKADSNGDGDITVTELKNFVGKEVERLTKGEQKPTSRRENLEFDFIVW